MALACASLAWAGPPMGKVEGTAKGISGREYTVVYVEDALGAPEPGARFVLDQKDKVFLPLNTQAARG